VRRDRAGLFAFSIFRKASHDRPRYGDSSLKGKGVYLGRLYLPKNKSGADSGRWGRIAGRDRPRCAHFSVPQQLRALHGLRTRSRLSTICSSSTSTVAPRPTISKLRGRSCCSWRRLDHCLLLNNPGPRNRHGHRHRGRRPRRGGRIGHFRR
jgi:hypothetical protein